MGYKKGNLGKYYAMARTGLRIGQALYSTYQKRGIKASSKAGPSRQSSKGKGKAAVRAIGRRRFGRATMGGFIPKARRSAYRATRKRFQIDSAGCSLTREYGGEVTDEHCVILGHATAAYELTKKIFFLGLLKKLSILMGQPFVRCSDVPDYADYTNDRVIVLYRGPASADAEAAITFNPGAAAYTWENIADYFVAQTDGLAPEYILTTIQFTPGTGGRVKHARLNLRNAKVKYYAKSSFKFQNRTIETAGDDNADVDNVPVNGKQYSGKWNGSRYTGDKAGTTPIIGADTNGLIVVQAAANEDLKEPLIAQHWTNCKAAGKIRLDPGKLRTSLLTTQMTLPVNEFFSRIQSAAAGTTTSEIKLGQHTFYAMEKMICAINAVNMTFAYEHNLNLGLAVVGGTNQPTVPLFISNF